MLERPQGGNRALLVEVDLGTRDSAERLSELSALAQSAGAKVVGQVTGRRARPEP